MAHITTLTRAYDDLHNSQANTYSYSGSFETFKESEVKVKLNDTLLTYNSSPSDATQYSVNLTDKTIHVGGGNLSSGTLSIYPETDLGAPTLKAPYTAGSAITASDLTNNQKQVMRKILEHKETKLNNTGGTMTGDLTMGEDRNIIFEGATDNAHETTITVADPTTDRTITFPNVTGNVVTTGDDGTVTSTMITNNTIVDADVNSSAAIAGTKISPNFGGQNIVTTGSLTVGSTLAVTGAIDFNGGANIDNIQIGVTGDNEIDTSSGNLTIDSAGGTVTIDDALAVSGGASLNSTLGVTGTSTLSNITGGAVVTSGTSTSDTKVYSAKRAGEIFYGKGTVEEIQSGETWSAADDKVATTAAIDARIIDLVDDVGGFVPIANELSFPNSNPDVNDGAGTLVSIKSLSQNYTSSGSGVITISNGTVGNSTVTIVGADNSTTYAAGYGLIVETHADANKYTFHRLVPKATEVTSVVGNATNINTVATNITNVNTVAGDIADVNALAAKTTELGLLGTSAVVTDLSILGTTDVVADLNTLGTADVVADMNMLATSDVVADMALLATTDVISDMNTLAVSGVISDMDTVATNVTNVNNVGSNITSVNTAASNLTSINNFGDKYQVSANNPSTDGGGIALAAGDLYFNTSANELKVYNGSSWQGGVTATGSFAATTGNTFTGDNVYNDNVKLKLGTGSDLEIFHNASDTKITNSTGGLLIQNSGTGNIHLEPATNENGILVKPNGAVDLFYDNSKKLETTSGGASVTGNLDVSSGVDVTGNITVTGTVDGVDIAGLNTTVGNIDTDLLADTSPQLGGDLQSNGHDIKIADATGYDGNNIYMGTGNDVRIWHDGSNFEITESTGDVTIQSADDIILKPQGGENGIKVIGNGSVELYHDNTKMAYTSASGFDVTNGDLRAHLDLKVLSDDRKLFCGANADLRVYHSGSHSYLQNVTDYPLWIQNIDGQDVNISDNNGGNLAAKFHIGGGAELYHDNSKKFHTYADGCSVFGHLNLEDNDQIRLGNSSDLKIYHDNTNNYVDNLNGTLKIRLASNADFIELQQDRDVWIKGNPKPWDNNTYALGTSSYKWSAVHATTYYGDGSNLTGVSSVGGSTGVDFNDDVKIRSGTGNDLEIWHSSNNNSYIKNNTGELKLASDDLALLTTDQTEKHIQCNNNGAVELYHDNVQRVQTTADGATITGPGNYTTLLLERSSGTDSGKVQGWSNGDSREIGFAHPDTASWFLRCDKNTNNGSTGAIFFTTVRPSSNNTYDLGSSSNRWANIYANDFHLSNEGSSNDMDGTWGDWTIQEGESDLFLKNNRSGKKYKFNLTEVA